MLMLLITAYDPDCIPKLAKLPRPKITTSAPRSRLWVPDRSRGKPRCLQRRNMAKSGQIKTKQQISNNSKKYVNVLFLSYQYVGSTKCVAKWQPPEGPPGSDHPWQWLLVKLSHSASSWQPWAPPKQPWTKWRNNSWNNFWRTLFGKLMKITNYVTIFAGWWDILGGRQC